jgi:hypothetical protein
MYTHTPWPRAIRVLLISATLGLTISTAAPAFAQSDPPPSADPAAIADAYGTLSVFILDVAAGLDGVPKDPQGEQVFHDAFAQQMLTAFGDLDSEDQQGLAQLPNLRAAVLTAWPQLPDSQRSAIAEEWRQSVQSELAGVPCPMYDALARAYLIPGGDAATVKANGDHLVQCWNQYPELARGRNGEDLNAQRQQQQRSSAGNDAIYRGLMNAEVTNYAGTMNMISIMSGDPYRWTVK